MANGSSSSRGLSDCSGRAPAAVPATTPPWLFQPPPAVPAGGSMAIACRRPILPHKDSVTRMLQTPWNLFTSIRHHPTAEISSKSNCLLTQLLAVLSCITPGSCPRPILQGPSSGTLPSAIMPLTTSLSSRCMRRRSFHRWTVASRSSCSRCICALHRILSHLARCSVRQSLTVYVPDLAIK